MPSSPKIQRRLMCVINPCRLNTSMSGQHSSHTELPDSAQNVGPPHLCSVPTCTVYLWHFEKKIICCVWCTGTLDAMWHVGTSHCIDTVTYSSSSLLFELCTCWMIFFLCGCIISSWRTCERLHMRLLTWCVQNLWGEQSMVLVASKFSSVLKKCSA